jgi:hypothetical protein
MYIYIYIYSGLSWIGMGGSKKNPVTNTGPNTPDKGDKVRETYMI